MWHEVSGPGVRKCVCLPFFFHGPIRSDDQPPVLHFVSIFSIQRDPVFHRDSLCAYRRPFCDVIAVWRLWSSTSSLPTHFPLDHTLQQLAPAVSKEGEFATYNKAVWWCQAPWGCFRLFYVQSNRLVTSDDKSTFLLIGSFPRQLLSESSLLRHRWELSTPASVLVSFSDLCWIFCLSISVQDRASFSWPFQFGIWCLYYNCRQLISVSRDIWNVQPPQFLHHPLKLLHRTASSQFPEVWSFSHLISVTLIFSNLCLLHLLIHEHEHCTYKKWKSAPQVTKSVYDWVHVLCTLYE